MQNKLISYLVNQRREAQWGILGETLIEEVIARMGPDEARNLWVHAGMRAGQSLSLPQCDSLSQMEAAANHHWASVGWGVVTFTEQGDCLEIHHRFIPEGAPSHVDLAAFFEGLYQQWFIALGAGSQLHVRLHESPDQESFLYRLAV